MRLLVCFDIVDDKKRRNIVDCILSFGVRCQYSVFELDLDHATFKAFQLEIKKIGFDGSDKFYVYPIPSEYCGTIWRVGEYSKDESVIVI